MVSLIKCSSNYAIDFLWELRIRYNQNAKLKEFEQLQMKGPNSTCKRGIGYNKRV